MEEACQQAWNRDIEPGPEPSPEVTLPGSEDWRLLLQLDSDDQMGSDWGDGGTLYFWVREQDARAADFSRTWLVMQFY